MNSSQKQLNAKKVLAIAAHPDDIDFGASCTISKLVERGVSAYYLILTNGNKGTADHTISSDDLIQMRQDEQRAAGKIIGLSDVFFLDHPDGGLEITQDLKKQIVRIIRTVKPDLVITMDPSVIYDVESGFINHPDHRAAGQAALDAVFPLARDHLSFPELYTDEHLEPHKTKQLLLINMTTGNYWTDISDMIDHKIAILHAHASQVPPTEQEVRTLVERIAARPSKNSPYDLSEQFVLIDIPS